MTCIINLSTGNEYVFFRQATSKTLFNDDNYKRVTYNTLNKDKWNLQSAEGHLLFEKLNQQPLKAKDVFEYISQGVVSVGDDIYIMKGYFRNDQFIGFSEAIKKEVEIEAELMKPLLKGEDIKKYIPLSVSNYIIYPHYQKDGKTFPYEEEQFKIKFPLAYIYFSLFKDELIKKKIRYKTNPKYWFALHRSREQSMFEQDKIITPEISLGTNMTIDTNNFYHNTKCYSLIKKNGLEFSHKYLLAILNSNLHWYYLNETGYILRGGILYF